MAANGACFICSKSTTYNSCPICYECSQAYKRAVIECISDIKKDDGRVDNKEISKRLANDKYANIVQNYLSKERVEGSYNTIIPETKIKKATNYLYETNRTPSIISELLFKGILMINENGNILEVSKDKVQEQRKEIMTSYNRSAAREDLLNMKRELTNATKNNQNEKNIGSGMFTNKFGR